MPASLFHEMDRSNGDHGLEDQRALQLAFELSMLGLSGSHSSADQQEQMNPAYADDARSKKSQNMTECVPVPSSEHVAEIVGRQGKKTRPRGHTLVVLCVHIHPAAMAGTVRHKHTRCTSLQPCARALLWETRPRGPFVCRIEQGMSAIPILALASGARILEAHSVVFGAPPVTLS
jgi:hypothetical protein